MRKPFFQRLEARLEEIKQVSRTSSGRRRLRRRRLLHDPSPARPFSWDCPSSIYHGNRKGFS